MNHSQQAPLSQAQQFDAVACLGDPVRKQLFELLKASAKPLSRDECAATLGLPKSTVRTHLDRLVTQGLLLVDFQKMGGRTGPGSGRPTKLYAAAVGEVAASVPARHYDLAAQLLASAVQRSIDTGQDVQDALSAVAFDAGRELGAHAGTVHQLLANTGYDPRPDGTGGTIMANCPFHRLAQAHTGVVCAMNGSLLNGALVGCGDKAHSVVPDEERSHCCARLVPTPQ
ncbi:metalloregulator ArsR/SmtB family transcription factor [Arthrobacter sp. GMC3]|uniref:helix-turn-helix transcriptional regulator n=1 Tax=Arthrobacter sp. GMC3 TaxID=2058894 RepID=UPI0015E4225E|nr:helix-turn-helix domain-containing protein [Arthrobacter sp. GMC3]